MSSCEGEIERKPCISCQTMSLEEKTCIGQEQEHGRKAFDAAKEIVLPKMTVCTIFLCKTKISKWQTGSMSLVSKPSDHVTRPSKKHCSTSFGKRKVLVLTCPFFAFRQQKADDVRKAALTSHGASGPSMLTCLLFSITTLFKDWLHPI